MDKLKLKKKKKKHSYPAKKPRRRIEQTRSITKKDIIK